MLISAPRTFQWVKPRLDELMQEREPRTTAKQRLTGSLLQRQLAVEGYQVGTTLVRQCLREMRRQRQEVFIPLIHRPGEEPQVDFSRSRSRWAASGSKRGSS